MKNRFIKLLPTLFLLIHGNSYAANGWYTGFSVSSLYIEPGGAGYTVLTNSSLNDCGQPGKFHFRRGDLGSIEMYSMALTALSKNKIIDIYVDAGKGCKYNGMVSTGISIHK